MSDALNSILRITFLAALIPISCFLMIYSAAYAGSIGINGNIVIAVEAICLGVPMYRILRKHEREQNELDMDNKNFLDPAEQDAALQYLLDAKAKKEKGL
jgi:hypothetical protein